AYPRMICRDPSDCVAHCKLDPDNGNCYTVVRNDLNRCNVCISFALQPGAKSSSTPTNRKYLLTPFSSHGLRATHLAMSVPIHGSFDNSAFLQFSRYSG